MLHIRVKRHSCLCFAAHQVSLFLPLFPYCSTAIPCSLQSQTLHSSLFHFTGGWKISSQLSAVLETAGQLWELGAPQREGLWVGVSSAVPAQEGGTPGPAPSAERGSKCRTASENEESNPRLFRSCIIGIKCQS